MNQLFFGKKFHSRLLLPARLLLVAGLLTFAATGCGYHLGMLGHPELKTVAVAPVVNNTALYNVASDMRMMACESFTQDGTLKLVNLSESDCTVYITVTEASFADVSDDSYDYEIVYKPKEWNARVNAEYKVIIPGQAKPLIQGKVTGDAHFQSAGDVEVSRLRAVRQACYVASQQIVYALTEGW